MCCYEQILERTLHKTTAVWPVLHQQLPVLNQRPLSCNSRYQQLPVLSQLTNFHQQIPVLNQHPSSYTSRNQSCTSDHLSNEYESCSSYPDLLRQLDPAPTITICPGDYSPYAFSIYDSP